jgi:short-subunit dehydrogenase
MNKVVVITGASSGIGAAIAREVASRGAVVVLVARREAALRAVAESVGRNFSSAGSAGATTHVVVADMTVRADVERVVAEALAACGRIDVWINNVGRGITLPPSQLTDADVDEMVRVNVKPALYGMQAVLPHFQSRGAGHIINISSILGRHPAPIARSAYNGAKHFLNALTANFRAEVQQSHPGIQVSLVSPGVVATDFGANALHGGPLSKDLPDPQSPEEVAVVVANVIESRRPDVYTRKGAKAYVDEYLMGLGEDP